MQLRTSCVPGDCPVCPVDKHHKIHRHGSYRRYANCSDVAPIVVIILRYLCVICRRTISVLPDPLLPYRAVPTPLVEKHFDALANGTSEPPASEKEKGCLQRAWAGFTGRVASLIAVLGQIIEKVQPGPAELWRQLRRWGNLPAILGHLAAPFQTSLLGDYRCLKPWRR